MKLLALVSSVLVLGSVSTWTPRAQAGDAPVVKTVVDEASGISETVFANGLRLLVKPQPDNPVATCMIWYAVGSRDEGVGETGLSHYLEHMLFKGSDKYPKGAIDKATQMNGGSNNASTREDATEYHFTFPADSWEVALEIESNRMRNSNCQQAEFDAEKKVVLNELWAGLDNPEDVLYTRTMSALFVSGLYHHPVIGWQEDVESTTRERMMKYYLKHYTPDRATIVIVGGVDRDRTIAKVGELFGPIPRGETVRFEAKEQKILGETRLTLIQDTQIARVMMAWRSMSILDKDEPLLDVFSAILSGDKTSRLDKALVETGIAATAGAYSDSLRDDGAFIVQAQPAGEHTLDEVEAAIRKVLAELLAKGVTAEELARAKAKILAERVFGQESSMGLAERIGSLAVVGDWRYELRYPAKIEAATPETVMAAAKRVIDLDRLVVGRSIPKTADAKGADDKPADDKPAGPAAPAGAGSAGGGGGAPPATEAPAPKRAETAATPPASPLQFRVVVRPSYAEYDDRDGRRERTRVWSGSGEFPADKDGFDRFKQKEIDAFEAAKKAGVEYKPSDPAYRLLPVLRASDAPESLPNSYELVEEPSDPKSRFGGEILENPRSAASDFGEVVLFEVKPEFQRAFGEWTGHNVRLPLAIILDGEIVTAPQINEKLTTNVQITMGGSSSTTIDGRTSRSSPSDQAKRIVALLQLGASKPGAPPAGGRDGARDAGASAAIGTALTLEPVRKVLPNGLTVLVLKRTTAPVFAASLQVVDGRLGEATPGLDAMTGSLLEEGTTLHTGAEIAALIGAVGGSINVAGTGASAKTLAKDAGLALDLMAEVVRKPAFAADAIERVRQQQLAAIAEELDTPRAVGQSLFNRAIYGPTHPLGRSANGTPESVTAITREQIVAHHGRFFVPKNATLAIVTDRDAADVLALVERSFGDWAGGDKPVVTTPAIPEPAARVMRKSVDAAQANIFVGHVGIERKDPDYTALEVFDNVFGTGSGFTSRLAMNVRDQKGLAYTVFGDITGNAGIRPGTLRVFAGTKPEDWAVALKEMHLELEGMLTRPPSPEELAGAKAALRGAMVSACESSSDLAGLLLMLERFGLGFDYPKRHVEELAKITSEDVVRVAKAHVKPDRLVELVVAPGLAAQGLDPAPAPAK